MGKLSDIVTKFDNSRLVVTGIKSFVFDEMSAINADKEKYFPAMLFKPPVSNFFGRAMENKDWKIDFFLFDIWNVNSEDETRKIQDVWQELEDLSRAVVAHVAADRPTYVLVNPNNEPIITLGYP